MSRTPALLHCYEVVDKLIDMVSEVSFSLLALRLLKCVHGSDWSLLQTEHIHSKALELLSSTNPDINPIANHSNPLLFCVALSETCEHLSRFKLLYREKFQQLGRQYRDLAIKIQSQYVEYRQLKVLYTERSYGSENLFDIITQHTERYRTMLKSDTVVAIAEDLWTGGSDGAHNFESLCYVTRYFGREQQALFGVHRMHCHFANCVFQLCAWKRNCSLKFIFEAIGLVLVYSLMAYSSATYTHSMRILRTPTSPPEDMLQAQKDMSDGKQTITVYCCFTATLVLYVLQKMAYKFIRNLPGTPPAKDWMDIFLFFLALFNQVANLDLITSRVSVKTLQEIIEPTFSVMFLLAGLRMCVTLLITRTFGPMIRMIFVIVQDIMSFLGVYIVLIMSFAIFCTTMFYMTDEFSTIYASTRTLYQWSVSGADLTVFAEKELWGTVTGAVFMFMCALILLNLLIAVLSARYEELAPQCTADYVSIMYRSYRESHYSKPFGALVMAPAPVTILTLPLMPAYFLYPRSAEYLDSVFVVLSYQCMFCVGLLAFLVYSIAYSVLAYWYVSGEILRRYGCRGVSKCALWLLIGPGYLAFLVGLSLLNFCKCMYTDTHEQPSEGVPEEVLIPVRKFLKTVKASRLSMEEVMAATARFPPDTRSPRLPPTPVEPVPFALAAKRMMCMQPQLSASRRAKVLELFEQFKSYSPEEVGLGSIDVARMLRFVSTHPNTLAAINLYFAQKALVLLQTEHSLKRKRGKPVK